MRFTVNARGQSNVSKSRAVADGPAKGPIEAKSAKQRRKDDETDTSLRRGRQNTTHKPKGDRQREAVLQKGKRKRGRGARRRADERDGANGGALAETVDERGPRARATPKTAS